MMYIAVLLALTMLDEKRDPRLKLPEIKVETRRFY